MKFFGLISLLFLSSILGNGFGLQILNSSPVTSARTVVISLSTEIDGPYSFSCQRESGLELNMYDFPIPNAQEKANVPRAVFYGIFEENDTVNCVVNGRGERETGSTKVQIVSPSEIPFRLRKEFRDLTYNEKKDFFDAVVELKNLYVYDYLVWIHTISTETMARNPGEEGCVEEQCTNKDRDIAHAGPAFLPWHREYVHLYEDCLIMASPGKIVASHYWNWLKDSEVGGDSVIFTAEFFGSINKTQLEIGEEEAQVIDGPLTQDRFPLRQAPLEDFNTGLMRVLGGSNLPNYSHLRVVLCSDEEYDIYPWQRGTIGSWRDVIEGFTNTAGGFHNMVHNWVGGTMGPPPWSSNDPIFFAHHTFVDAVFLQWQIRYPNRIYLPLDSDETAPVTHRASALMIPFGNTANGVWKAETFGYDMKDLGDVICGAGTHFRYPKK